MVIGPFFGALQIGEEAWSFMDWHRKPICARREAAFWHGGSCESATRSVIIKKPRTVAPEASVLVLQRSPQLDGAEEDSTQLAYSYRNHSQASFLP